MTKGISCANQLIKNHICIIEVKLIVFQKFSVLKILMMLYHENFFGGSVGCQVRLCDCVCIEWKKLNHRWSMSSLLWAWCILRHVLYINTQSSQSHLQFRVTNVCRYLCFVNFLLLMVLTSHEHNKEALLGVITMDNINSVTWIRRLSMSRSKYQSSKGTQ